MNYDPVALVTGANQGIGLQIAKDLSTKGYTVVIGSRDHAKGVAAAREVGSGAIAVQLDVTDQASIAAAAARITNELGRLDVLVNNAAISHTTRTAGMSLQDHARAVRPSNIALDEVRTIWETNVFGVIAVIQAMLPLLRGSSVARIVNMSSVLGSLTTSSNPAWPYRSIFSPGYAASKTALNAITHAFAIELESSGIKVNAVSPGFIKTNLNGYEGTQSLEEGAREVVRVALLGPDSPTGGFTRWPGDPIPW
jgi:NAD(P)-dependent dehydrogenase (short-subunit alcohol dehydrogenase family)